MALGLRSKNRSGGLTGKTPRGKEAINNTTEGENGKCGAAVKACTRTLPASSRSYSIRVRKKDRKGPDPLRKKVSFCLRGRRWCDGQTSEGHARLSVGGTKRGGGGDASSPPFVVGWEERCRGEKSAWEEIGEIRLRKIIKDSETTDEKKKKRRTRQRKEHQEKRESTLEKKRKSM